jgi:hypothetical protein
MTISFSKFRVVKFSNWQLIGIVDGNQVWTNQAGNKIIMGLN